MIHIPPAVAKRLLHFDKLIVKDAANIAYRCVALARGPGSDRVEFIATDGTQDLYYELMGNIKISGLYEWAKLKPVLQEIAKLKGKEPAQFSTDTNGLIIQWGDNLVCLPSEGKVEELKFGVDSDGSDLPKAQPIDPAAVFAAFKKAEPFRSNDAARSYLGGFRFDGPRGRIVATNGRMLIAVDMPVVSVSSTVQSSRLIRSSIFAEYCEGSIASDDSLLVVFKTGPWTLEIDTQFSDLYPKWEQIRNQLNLSDASPLILAKDPKWLDAACWAYIADHNAEEKAAGRSKAKPNNGGSGVPATLVGYRDSAHVGSYSKGTADTPIAGGRYASDILDPVSSVHLRLDVLYLRKICNAGFSVAYTDKVEGHAVLFTTENSEVITNDYALLMPMKDSK